MMMIYNHIVTYSYNKKNRITFRIKGSKQGRRGEEGREKGIKVKGARLHYLVLMGRISARFLRNPAFSERKAPH